MLAGVSIAAALVALFCTSRNASSEQEEPQIIRKLNDKIEETYVSIRNTNRTFEKFSFEPAMAAAAAVAHRESQSGMDRARRLDRAWRKETHGAAAAGAAACALAVALALAGWNHLWPVDRCREVLRARRGASMPAAVAPWRFVGPPSLFLVGLACVAAAAGAQWRETDPHRRQRNAFALYAAALVLAAVGPVMLFSASFARDASVVVAWLRRARPTAAEDRDAEEQSVCKRVARDIQTRSIQP
jgi:hypothetical protein